MKRQWTAEELTEHWSLSGKERAVVGRRSATHELLFAVLLKFFAREGRFPQTAEEVPSGVVAHLAAELGLKSPPWGEEDWQGRTVKRLREQIRQYLSFRETGVEDLPKLG